VKWNLKPLIRDIKVSFLHRNSHKGWKDINIALNVKIINININVHESDERWKIISEIHVNAQLITHYMHLRSKFPWIYGLTLSRNSKIIFHLHCLTMMIWTQHEYPIYIRTAHLQFTVISEIAFRQKNFFFFIPFSSLFFVCCIIWAVAWIYVWTWQHFIDIFSMFLYFIFRALYFYIHINVYFGMCQWWDESKI
jgi:hypothetical protein